MKLAVISDTFSPNRTSAAVQLRDLTRELHRQGHEVTVFLPNAELERPWRYRSHEGVMLLHLKSPQTKDLGLVRRTINEFLMSYIMRRNLKRSPIGDQIWDGVIWYSPSIFHAPLVKFIKRKSGCSGYLIIRDVFPEWAFDLGLLSKGLPYYFFKFIAYQQYQQANIIGVQTEGNIGYFAKWYRHHPQRLLEVLPNWLGPPGKVRCQFRVDQSLLFGRKIFVYAGNMGVAQGLDILIDLAARVQDRTDIGFLLVGRGSDASRLSERSRSLELDNILFQDEIDPDEIPDLYQQCTAGIVVLDPRHKSHNIPGKFLTYMQSGLPVLANINLGNDLANIIREQRVGEVNESNDVKELEKKLLSLLERIDSCECIKQNCKELFQELFSVSKTVHQITSALESTKRY